jgi:protein ECT2
MSSYTAELPSMDVDLALETTLVNISQPPVTHHYNTPSQLPRSKRQPFLPTGNTDATPKLANGTSATPTSVQPLSIKKKTSIRSSTVGTPTPVRRAHVRNSPLARTGGRIASPRRVSPQVRSTRTNASSHGSARGGVTDRAFQLLQTSREDVSYDYRLS